MIKNGIETNKESRVSLPSAPRRAEGCGNLATNSKGASGSNLLLASSVGLVAYVNFSTDGVFHIVQNLTRGGRGQCELWTNPLRELLDTRAKCPGIRTWGRPTIVGTSKAGKVGKSKDFPTIARVGFPIIYTRLSFGVGVKVGANLAMSLPQNPSLRQLRGFDGIRKNIIANVLTKWSVLLNAVTKNLETQYKNWIHTRLYRDRHTPGYKSRITARLYLANLEG